MGIYTIKRILNDYDKYEMLSNIMNSTKNAVENKDYYEIGSLPDKFGRSNHDLVFYGVISYFYDETEAFDNADMDTLLNVLNRLWGHSMDLDYYIDKFKEEYILNE